MELHLKMFEQAIRKQAELVGEQKALRQARKAGLGVSSGGHIVSCDGNPQVVLLRLIRYFTEDGNLAALMQCTPLIQKLTKLAEELAESTPADV